MAPLPGYARAAYHPPPMPRRTIQRGNQPETVSHATPARPARHEPACRANPVGQAAFSRAPSGTSPVVTYFHSATSSFLARATAAILRMRPRTAPTRSANRRARALSGW